MELDIDILSQVGYDMPLADTVQAHKPPIVKAVTLHHCILSVKAELDEIGNGLQTLGVLGILKKYPDQQKSYFCQTGSRSLAAGI